MQEGLEERKAEKVDMEAAGEAPVSYTHLDVYKRQGKTGSCVFCRLNQERFASR